MYIAGRRRHIHEQRRVEATGKGFCSSLYKIMCQAAEYTAWTTYIGRSSTSAASNYRAVCIAQSRAAFVSKLAIVIEETDESYFRIEYAADEKLIKKEKEQVSELIQEATELTAIFVASQNTARRNKK